MFLLVAISLLALASGYIGIRLLPALSLESAGRALAVLVLALPVALACASVLAWTLERPVLARRLRHGAALTLGWLSTLLFLTLLREVALAVGGWLLPAAADPALRFWSALAVPAGAALACAIGAYAARRHPRLVEVLVPLADLSPDLCDFSIVQISDLHIGATIQRRFVERIVARVNHLGPDLIAITGDLVDGSLAELREDVAPLAALRARHGSFFVTGNHEYYAGAAQWLTELPRLGIRTLVNEHVIVGHGRAALLLAGVTDKAAQQFDEPQGDPQAALRGAPPQLRPRILLAHRPRIAPAAERAGFDLQLSGHTHGGQFWPWNLLVHFLEPVRIGLDRLHGLWVYTSRGTGYWGPPFRLGVPSEITRLRLVPAASRAPPAPPADAQGQRHAPEQRRIA